MQERLIGSIYVGKSDKFGCGLVSEDIAHTLLTGGESAIILGHYKSSQEFIVVEIKNDKVRDDRTNG